MHPLVIATTYTACDDLSQGTSMRGRILVVDTDESARGRVEAAIGLAPFDVQITAIPDDALGCIRKGKVDILIADRDSVTPDFLDQIASEKPDVVRVLSSAAPHPTFEHLKESRLLPKPWTPEVLQNTLRDGMQQAAMNFTACLCSTLRPPPPLKEPVGPNQIRSEPAPSTLSRREQEVQMLLAQGIATAHIARKLNISVFTVRNHVRSIYTKLGIHSRDAFHSLR